MLTERRLVRDRLCRGPPQVEILFELARNTMRMQMHGRNHFGMMNIMMSSTAALLLVASCSEAGWEGYGPLGQGFLGSAYGYADRPVGPGLWQVEYSEMEPDAARQGAQRRAEELCRQNGFASVDFQSRIVPRDGLVVAQGQARCLAAGASLSRQTGPDRVADIDAEIAALQQRRIIQHAPGSATGTTPLDIVASGLNRHSEITIDRQIEALQRERAQLR